MGEKLQIPCPMTLYASSSLASTFPPFLNTTFLFFQEFGFHMQLSFKQVKTQLGMDTSNNGLTQ
jgi:hypothetical protein